MVKNQKKDGLPEYFRVALKEIIDNSERGFQKQIARNAGITNGYINHILRGTRKGAEEVRRRISNALNISYEDMLERGRLLIEGDKISPTRDDFEFTRPHSIERATLIFRRAASRYHLDDHWLLTEDVLRASSPPGWHDYLNRTIGDLELYDIAHREMEKIVNKILSERRKDET